MEARHVNNKLVHRRPLLPACLLLVLAEEPGHGYELTERLKHWGFQLSGPGPIYRELRLLEEGGLVRSMWSAPQSGPVPRVYELTREGRDALARTASELAEMSEMLDDYQDRFRQLPPPPKPAGAAPRRSRRARA